MAPSGSPGARVPPVLLTVAVSWPLPSSRPPARVTVPPVIAPPSRRVSPAVWLRPPVKAVLHVQDR